MTQKALGFWLSNMICTRSWLFYSWSKIHRDTHNNDKTKQKALTCHFLEVNKDFNLVPFYYKKYIFQNYIKRST